MKIKLPNYFAAVELLCSFHTHFCIISRCGSVVSTFGWLQLESSMFDIHGKRVSLGRVIPKSQKIVFSALPADVQHDRDCITNSPTRTGQT